jgi:hypothetical protein
VRYRRSEQIQGTRASDADAWDDSTPTPTPYPRGEPLPMCNSKRGSQLTVLVAPSKMQRQLERGSRNDMTALEWAGAVPRERGKRVNVLLPASKVSDAG